MGGGGRRDSGRDMDCRSALRSAARGSGGGHAACAAMRVSVMQQAQMRLAGCYEQQGRTSDANKVYSDVLENNHDHKLAKEGHLRTFTKCISNTNPDIRDTDDFKEISQMINENTPFG